MPGWHDATAELQAEGAFRMVGILQEQHPDRALLFMQWKNMGWPLLVDALDLLEVAVVPLTLLIDEHGIVRRIGARPSDLAEFLVTDWPAPPTPVPAPRPPDLEALRRATLAPEIPAAERRDAWGDYGAALVQRGDAAAVDAAVSAFEEAVALAPEHGPLHFRLGVALRRRYDSAHRRPADFQRAVDHWTRALAIDPNQYIWRRRIQQYGPRLDKPYPFYNWVEEARTAIRARGEEPAAITVEPSGTELATPSKVLATGTGTATTMANPDPQGRIRRDLEGFVDVETVVVPSRIRPGEAGRVHLVFRPNTAIRAHWNNEAEGTVVWIDLPDGWRVDRQGHRLPLPPAATSLETRRVEFEVSVPDSATAGSVPLPAYALYYVCEDVDGTCLYRRQDLTVEIPVEVEVESAP